MVDLKPHNLEAYEKIKEALSSGKNRVAVSHATGSGKSYLIAQLCEDHNEDRKLILVPSNYIREQMQKLFTKYKIQNYEFMVYQKFIKLSDDDIASLDYKLIVLDEYHHNTSKVWGAKVKCLLESHSESIVFGTSATPVRSDGVNTIDELFEGSCASELSLSEAIAKKIVPIPTYVSAIYSLDDELEQLREKVKNATNTKEEKAEFYEKIKAMRTQIDKAYGIPIILNKYLKNKEGKYLVFCRNKAHVEEIKDTVIDWFKTAGFKDINSYIVHSSYEQRNKEYVSFCNDKSHKLKLLFSVNMLNEGLHLSDISGVLLLRPTNSNIVWHQQIGRCIEANNTENPVIIDATNNFQSIRQGIALLKAIKEAVEKEKGKNKDFDDKDFLELDTFFVTGYVQEIQQMFAEIEGRLTGSWDVYVKALEQYKAREGDCLVPGKHVEVMEDGMEVKLGQWANRMRLARDGIINFSLNVEKIKELDRLGFIWAVEKYRFKNKVNACIDYFNRNGKLPCRTKVKEDIIISCFISGSRKEINNNPNYPKWKIELLNQIPTFFEEKESIFYKFYRMALLYKERNGHVNIVRKDVIDGYNIGIKYQYLYLQYKDGKLTDEQVSKLQCIGLDITIGKREKEHTDKMNLVKQAINEGVAISRQNKFYKDVNLYNWRIEHKNFKKEELELINKLIPTCYKTAVKIIDVVNDRILGIYESISEAGRALYEEYQVVANANSGTSIICRYLKGKVKNPVYKGRFIFQYVNSTDQSEPA